MEKEVTLGEIFAKSNVDELNGYFDSEKFNKDVEQMSKAETEQLLGQIQSEILKGGDYEILTEMRSIALDHIEKARSGVYADTAQNRKLGRVGQQYGGKKSEDDDKTPEWKKNALKILDKKRDSGEKSSQGREDKQDKKKKTSEDRLADENKRNRIKDWTQNGLGSGDSKFMSKNEQYFKGVLKKHGFEHFSDFEDAMEDMDYSDVEKIFANCAKKIPSSVYAEAYGLH